ncbi:MAG: YraN family protein [Spirochaetia bacterium]|nr:YraN family protein [Spirochaetia bacterium]
MDGYIPHINRREQGMEFETEVVKFLVSRGYVIKERNFLGKLGEIDIVAFDEAKNLLIFVEVKARAKSTGVHPFEAVDFRKQRKIILAAKEYMMINNLPESYIRFDVVGVIYEGKTVLSIEAVADAFQA